MGMDIHGNAPTCESGIGFSNNVWCWSGLADYINEVAPDIAAKCECWYTNDGDGLGAADSAALAVAL
jgi:hypothetical protein